jgi:flagellar basal body-associated protein FliL
MTSRAQSTAARLLRHGLPWVVDLAAPILLIVAVVVIGAGADYPSWWISLQVVATVVAVAYLVVAWWVWPRSVRSEHNSAVRPGQLAVGVDDADDAPVLRWRRRSASLAITMAILVGAASAGAVAAALCGTASRDAQVDRNRRELPSVTSRLVATVFSYSAGHRAADRAAAARFVTGDFASTFNTPPPGLPDTTSVRWQAARVALDSVARSTATVTVAANVTETAADGRSSTSGKVVLLHLDRSGDQWRIADVRTEL